MNTREHYQTLYTPRTYAARLAQEQLQRYLLPSCWQDEFVGVLSLEKNYIFLCLKGMPRAHNRYLR